MVKFWDVYIKLAPSFCVMLACWAAYNENLCGTIALGFGAVALAIGDLSIVIKEGISDVIESADDIFEDVKYGGPYK